MAVLCQMPWYEYCQHPGVSVEHPLRDGSGSERSSETSRNRTTAVFLLKTARGLREQTGGVILSRHSKDSEHHLGL